MAPLLSLRAAIWPHMPRDLWGGKATAGPQVYCSWCWGIRLSSCGTSLPGPPPHLRHPRVAAFPAMCLRICPSPLPSALLWSERGSSRKRRRWRQLKVATATGGKQIVTDYSSCCQTSPHLALGSQVVLVLIGQQRVLVGSNLISYIYNFLYSLCVCMCVCVFLKYFKWLVCLLWELVIFIYLYNIKLSNRGFLYILTRIIRLSQMTFFIVIIRLKDMKERWKVRSRGKSEESFHIYVHVKNVQSTDVSLSLSLKFCFYQPSESVNRT